MLLTEFGRLALVRDCFRCAVKDVTSNGISSYLTIIPRARMGSESIAHDAEKIQLAGQKYRE